MQRVVTEVVNAVVSWQAYRWVPGRRFSMETMREIWGFSANLTVTQLIFLGLTRAQDVIVGATIGAAAVGIYRIAWRMTELITIGAIQPFSQVAVQTFSRLQDNAPDLAKASTVQDPTPPTPITATRLAALGLFLTEKAPKPAEAGK